MRHDVVVRITIDLPADLHQLALSIARDTGRTLSEVVADLMWRGLKRGEDMRIEYSELTGLPVVRGGNVITTEDVRSSEDEL